MIPQCKFILDLPILGLLVTKYVDLTKKTCKYVYLPILNTKLISHLGMMSDFLEQILSDLEKKSNPSYPFFSFFFLRFSQEMVSVTLALAGPDQFWCGGLTFGPRSLFHRRRHSLLDHHQVRFSSGQRNLIKTYHNQSFSVRRFLVASAFTLHTF